MSFSPINVIETRDLSKSFGEITALDKVNLKVPENAIFGFLGPNGAGKTTLMKVLLGLAQPSSGEGAIFGKDIITESISIRERIGYLPQRPQFIGTMTALENLEFTARFFFSGPGNLIRERCLEMLDLVGLADKSDRPTGNFSGGEQQRLGIAMAQVNYPDLLILDEPASSLDPLGRQSVLEIMERLQKHTTIFYSTHILDDVQQVSDHVAILNQGKLMASGPIEELLRGKESAEYTFSVKGSGTEVVKRLISLPWIAQVSQSQQNGTTSLQVSATDEIAAEKDLLRFILADPDILVTEFKRKEYELEEIFMAIVKGDNNDN